MIYPPDGNIPLMQKVLYYRLSAADYSSRMNQVTKISYSFIILNFQYDLKTLLAWVTDDGISST